MMNTPLYQDLLSAEKLNRKCLVVSKECFVYAAHKHLAAGFKCEGSGTVAAAKYAHARFSRYSGPANIGKYKSKACRLIQHSV